MVKDPRTDRREINCRGARIAGATLTRTASWSSGHGIAPSVGLSMASLPSPSLATLAHSLAPR